MKQIKVILDIIMTVCFLLLMKISFLGIALHELVGIGLFFFVCIHKLLNFKWISGVFRSFVRGNATSKAKFMFVLNIVILLFVAFDAVSGILISQTILTSIEASDTDLWSDLHHFAAYGSLVLLSVHIGLHWQMLMNFFKKLLSLKQANSTRTFLARATLIVIAVFGIRAITNPDIYCNFTAPFGTPANVYASQTATVASVPKRNGSDEDSTTSVASSSTDDSDAPTLEEYLGNLICTGCGRCCPLTALACGKGAQYKESAVAEYEETYGENNTADSEDIDPTENTTPSEPDSLEKDEEPQSKTPSNTSPMDFVGLMGLVIGGTHYTTVISSRKR